MTRAPQARLGTRPGAAGNLTMFLRYAALVVLLAGAPGLAGAQEPAPGGVTLYAFLQDGCPACERMKPFISSLEQALPGLEVREMEISGNPEYLKLLLQFGRAFEIDQLSVPALFLGEHGWLGYSDSVTRQITMEAERCLAEGCDDALAVMRGERTGAGDPAGARAAGGDPPTILGIDVDDLPIVASTALIAFLDGFNPCSLWVLTFLLAMVMHTGSRRRVLLVGSVFLLVTALVYGLFIVGIVRAVVLVAHVGWIRIAVVAAALAMGAVNIKDFFAFKQGVSLTLSDRRRTKIARRFGELGRSSKRPAVLIVTTAGLAAGIAIIELPCTAGFPVIWSNLIADAGLGFSQFALLLALYLVIYLLIEFVIIIAATITFRRVVMTERAGRQLKLTGGAIMVALALVLLIRPEAMDSLVSMLIVFASAVALSLVVARVDRLVRSQR